MKIWIINQYFPPDQAATAVLLGQVAEHLSQAHEITVICGEPTYEVDPENQADPKTFGRIQIPMGKKTHRRNLVGRVGNYMGFGLGLLHLAWKERHSPPDILWAWTDPPLSFIPVFLMAKMLKRPFVLTFQDIYPDIASAVWPRLRFFLSPLRAIRAFIIRQSRSISCICQDMIPVLESRLTLSVPVDVIPNWPTLDQREDALPALLEKPDDTFVVMHSGNIGKSQDFDLLVGIASKLKGHPKIVFWIIGDGARKTPLINTTQAQNLSNIHFFPYQPMNRLTSTLMLADVHFVSLRPEFLGLISPSKIHNLMHLGLPIISSFPESSDSAKAIEAYPFGTNAFQNIENLSEAILRQAEAPRNKASSTSPGQPASKYLNRYQMWLEHSATQTPPT